MKIKILLITIFTIVTQSLFSQVVVGAEQVAKYLPLLSQKRVGIVANHTSMVGDTHLVDTLNSLGVDIKYIYSPEHGFRGKQSAGAHINNSVDSKTGIKIVSLHGTTKTPPKVTIDEIDVIIFDLQDVGLRFYTYISTLYNVMSIAGECNKKVILLDRPNPNIYYVDGPILEKKHSSFVGMYPIPVVYGLTIGELGIMANSEGWLKNGVKCDLDVISIGNYTRDTKYNLPIAPSPNLPNDTAIQLYANLCLFEATPVSVGRGTEYPFQQYGSPTLNGYSYNFTPTPNEGAVNPPCNGKKCYGVLLTNLSEDELYRGKFDLSYIIDAYKKIENKEKFFSSFLEKLVGVGYVREMIESGKSADEIALKWRDEVEEFKIKREKYLIYK